MVNRLVIEWDDLEVSRGEVVRLVHDHAHEVMQATKARPKMVRVGDYWLHGTETKSQKKIRIVTNNLRIADPRGRRERNGREGSQNLPRQEDDTGLDG